MKRSPWVVLNQVRPCAIKIRQAYHDLLTKDITMASTDVEKTAPTTVHVDDPSAEKPGALDIIPDGQRPTRQSPEEQRLDRLLRWKIDLYILPLVAIIYFLGSMVTNPLLPLLRGAISPPLYVSDLGMRYSSNCHYQDRNDIGSAAVAGMVKQLHFSAQKYYLATSSYGK